jgi:hypothetical protein
MRYSEKTLERISKVLDSAEGLSSSEFSPMVNNAIVAAVSDRSSLELKQKAWMLVYNSLHSYICQTVRHYAIKGNGEDYMNDFFIVIMENLDRWKPEQGKLTTFFGPLLEKSCNMTQFKEQTFTSMYYRDAYIDITKVIDELAVKGITEPTEKQIFQALKKKGLKHSLKTIRETMYQNIRIVSLDAPNEEDNCLLDVLSHNKTQNKTSKRVNAAIECMSSTNRVIMNVENEFYSKEINRKKMTIYELRDEIKKVPGFDGISLGWLKNKRIVAEREFIHKYRSVVEAG